MKSGLFGALALIACITGSAAHAQEYPNKPITMIIPFAAGGSASHLCGMLFMSAIGTELTTVPYKGTAPAMNDLLGGQVDLMCDQTTNTTDYIKSDKVKVYGLTTKTRLPSLPDVPTL